MKTALTILTLVFLSFIATLIYVSENRNNCEELINKKLLNREYSELIDRKKNKLHGSKSYSNKKRQEEDDKTGDDLDSLINSLARRLETVRFDSKLSRKINDKLDKTDQVPLVCHCKPDKGDYSPPYDDNNCIDHTYDYSCDDFFESQKKSECLIGTFKLFVDKNTKEFEHLHRKVLKTISRNLKETFKNGSCVHIMSGFIFPSPESQRTYSWESRVLGVVLRDAAKINKTDIFKNIGL
ncbi:hypothetical protein KQX54_019269 [Cotesia glomerata]|uniref:Uncharacterized protein n=1 Tax=Cotesia glomerata TaxID=32391 RepID=A0AAV7IN74_COTGL|nr:hypothetical protein KQX54_019269 [Cotesia glomerata]